MQHDSLASAHEGIQVDDHYSEDLAPTGFTAADLRESGYTALPLRLLQLPLDSIVLVLYTVALEKLLLTLSHRRNL